MKFYKKSTDLFLKKLTKNEPLNNSRGQGLMEYLILVALIAVVSIGAVKIVGKNMYKQYEMINRALGSRTQGQLTIESAENVNSQKDLSNFFDNARAK